MVSSLDNTLYQPRKTTGVGGEGEDRLRILTAKGRGKKKYPGRNLCHPRTSQRLLVLGCVTDRSWTGWRWGRGGKLRAAGRNHLKTCPAYGRGAQHLQNTLSPAPGWRAKQVRHPQRIPSAPKGWKMSNRHPPSHPEIFSEPSSAFYCQTGTVTPRGLFCMSEDGSKWSLFGSLVRSGPLGLIPPLPLVFGLK